MGNRLSERRTSQKFAKQVIATLSLDDIANDACLFLFVLFVYFISSRFYYLAYFYFPTVLINHFVR